MLILVEEINKAMIIQAKPVEIDYFTLKFIIKMEGERKVHFYSYKTGN